MTKTIEHLNQLATRDQNAQSAAVSMDLWVPSEQLLIFELDVPKLPKRKVQEMLPWMLEDQLLSSPDNFEFILGPQINGDLSLVYVIEKSVISQWLMLAESAAVQVQNMVPDFLALPYEEGRWTLYTESGRLLVRTGLYTGFAADMSYGWQQLELLLGQNEQSLRVSHLEASAVDIPESITAYLDTQSGSISWAFAEPPTVINLLPSNSNGYRPKHAAGLSLWFAAMISAAFATLLLITYLLVQSWVWQRDIGILEAGVAETYQALFAEKLIEPVATVRNQAQSRLDLLEHQYISMQISPMAELNDLDPILSPCSDCSLLEVIQIEKGLRIKLKAGAGIRAQLEGLRGRQISWDSVDPQGYSNLTIESSSR